MKTYIKGKSREERDRARELLGRCEECGALFGMSLKEANEQGVLDWGASPEVYSMPCENCKNWVSVFTPNRKEYLRLRTLADNAESKHDEGE